MLILAPVDGGTAFHIVALGNIDAEGNTNIPYFEFCRRLARKHQSEMKQIERLLCLVKDSGVAALGDRLRKLTDCEQLWELRTRNGSRLFCFFGDARTLICLCGYRKQGQKTPRREIAKARAWKKAFDVELQKRRIRSTSSLRSGARRNMRSSASRSLRQK